MRLSSTSNRCTFPARYVCASHFWQSSLFFSARFILRLSFRCLTGLFRLVNLCVSLFFSFVSSSFSHNIPFAVSVQFTGVMTETTAVSHLLAVLRLLAVPCIAMWVGGFVVLWKKPGPKLSSACQHLSAGELSFRACVTVCLLQFSNATRRLSCLVWLFGRIRCGSDRLGACPRCCSYRMS